MVLDQSARARGLSLETRHQAKRGGTARFLPQQLGIMGQGESAVTYSTTKRTVSSANEVGQVYGFRSPLYLTARELLPQNGDGIGTIPLTIYPLDDAGGATPSVGDITPSGNATQNHTVYVRVNGILSRGVTIPEGAITVATVVADLVAACDAILHFPMIATDNLSTDAVLTSSWSGASANDLHIEVVDAAGETPDFGVTFAITQPAGGATNPDVDPALALVGSRWETMLLNCLDIADTTTLDKYRTWGEGRWGELVRKPAVVFTGNTIAAVAAAYAVANARPSDRVNSQLVAPGSVSLPCVVAARQLARIARLANTNPPHDYGSQLADGILPGPDASQWDYTQKDQAVKAGSSTSDLRGDVVAIGDVVTFWKPEGEEPPAYSHVVDIVKLQQIIHNTNLLFNTPEWDGAPLVPDGQVTTNPAAKRPGTAKTALAKMIRDLGREAIVSDPDAIVDAIEVTINAANPKRLDFVYAPSLSGNTNIKSGLLLWSFYFGG